MGILRIFLAMVVLLYHTPEGIVPRVLHPALAVQCFYCISGFYVQLLIRQFQTIDGNWKIAFYKSRFLRIFPTYYIFLIATVLLLGSLTHHIQSDSLPTLTLFLFNNIFIFSQDLLRIFHLGGLTVSGQSWTLAIELMFYCVAPFLLTKNNRLIILIIIASIVCRLTLNSFDLNQHHWLYGFFPSEISIFLLGSLAYRFYETFLKDTDTSRIMLIKMIGLFALIYLLYFDLIGWHKINGGNWDGPNSAGVPYKYWAVLFLTMVCLPFIFKMSKSSKIDRFIGELSYPLYMGHFFVLFLIQNRVPERFQNIVTLIITMIISLAVIFLIETPVARYRESFKKSKLEPQGLEMGLNANPAFQEIR